MSAICIGLGYAGRLLIEKEYDSPSRTTITFSQDEVSYKLNAIYPMDKSHVIGDFLKT